MPKIFALRDQLQAVHDALSNDMDMDLLPKGGSSSGGGDQPEEPLEFRPRQTHCIANDDEANSQHAKVQHHRRMQHDEGDDSWHAKEIMMMTSEPELFFHDDTLSSSSSSTESSLLLLCGDGGTSKGTQFFNVATTTTTITTSQQLLPCTEDNNCAIIKNQLLPPSSTLNGFEAESVNISDEPDEIATHPHLIDDDSFVPSLTAGCTGAAATEEERESMADRKRRQQGGSPKPPPHSKRRWSKKGTPPPPDYQRFQFLFRFRLIERRKRDGRRLNQRLSPKALFPNQPPLFKVIVVTIDVKRWNQEGFKGCAAAASSTGSGSAAGGGNSGSAGNGYMRGYKSGGGSSAGKNNGGAGTGNNNEGEFDLGSFEYPDSPTSHKWLTDNPDLSPLTVLDNINLKTEFPYSANTTDIDKPPDLNGHHLDVVHAAAAAATATGTAAAASSETLFQFTASVPPVPPDSSTPGFLDNDLGGHGVVNDMVFTQSLYDDLVDINLNDFNLTSLTSTTVAPPLPPLAVTTTTSAPKQTRDLGPLLTAPLPPTTTITPTVITTQLPTTDNNRPLTKIMTKSANYTLNDGTTTLGITPAGGDFTKLKVDLNCSHQTKTIQIRPRQIDLGSLSLSVLPTLTPAATPTQLLQPASQVNLQDPPPVLKTIVEPLPESALQGLIKVEPEQRLAAAASMVNVSASQTVFGGNASIFSIKLENSGSCGLAVATAANDVMTAAPMPLVTPVSPSSEQLALLPLQQAVVSPSSSSCTAAAGPPPPPEGGGGKVKSARKKGQTGAAGATTTIMTIKAATPSIMVSDDDDLSNIQSLETRIQIISHRLGIPENASIEVINGGHGIKNPLSGPETGGSGGDKAAPAAAVSVEKLPPMRLESDPTKFQCRMCTKTFSLQRLLNRHMKCHSDTKRYLCTFCGKGFNDTFDLKRHTRTHTGVRPYRCNLCEKSFTQRCSLESHCLKVHGVAHQYDYKQRRSKMYVCEDCGHTTAEPEVHYIHLKDNHPHSPALLKFYDKRHFKFSNTDFANILLQVN